MGQEPGTFQPSLLQVGVYAEKINGYKGAKSSICYPFRKSLYGVPRWLSVEGLGIQAGGIRTWGECLPLPSAWQESLLPGLVCPGDSVRGQLTHIYAGCPHQWSWHSQDPLVDPLLAALPAWSLEDS